MDDDDGGLMFWQQFQQQFAEVFENDNTNKAPGGNSENTERTEGPNQHVRRLQVPELRGYSDGSQAAAKRTGTDG